MMKRLFCGRFTEVARPKRLRRLSGEHRKAGIIAKAVLMMGIVLGLALSCVFASQLGENTQTVAFGGTSMPADKMRIDASGMDGVFKQSVVDPRLIIGTEMPVIYGVEIEEIELNGHENAQEQNSDIYFDILPDDIKLEILRFADDEPREFNLAKGEPQILIYHTHATEAYRPVEGQEYQQTSKWRTEDSTKSIVSVGEILKRELESRGFSVLHDTTNHEPPELNTAYGRSLKSMEDYKREYPSLRLFIDVHRDAYNDVEAGSKDYVVVNGEECARVMFVVGTGENFKAKPNYESNYKLALAVTNELEDIKKGFVRPIRVKTSRYNQHISDMCLLVEVGHNANTLDQAQNAAKYVAEALSRVINME